MKTFQELFYCDEIRQVKNWEDHFKSNTGLWINLHKPSLEFPTTQPKEKPNYIILYYAPSILSVYATFTCINSTRIFYAQNQRINTTGVDILIQLETFSQQI